MNLIDVLIGVVIIGGAFWLYNKNSGVRDFLTLGQSTKAPPNIDPETGLSNDLKQVKCPAGQILTTGGCKPTPCGYGDFPPCKSSRARITVS